MVNVDVMEPIEAVQTEGIEATFEQFKSNLNVNLTGEGQILTKEVTLDTPLSDLTTDPFDDVNICIESAVEDLDDFSGGMVFIHDHSFTIRQLLQRAIDYRGATFGDMNIGEPTPLDDTD